MVYPWASASSRYSLYLRLYISNKLDALLNIEPSLPLQKGSVRTEHYQPEPYCMHHKTDETVVVGSVQHRVDGLEQTVMNPLP